MRLVSISICYIYGREPIKIVKPWLKCIVPFADSQILGINKVILNKRSYELQNKINQFCFHQGEIQRMVIRLEQLRAQVKWDQAALEAWSTAADRVGEDHALLEHFSQLDEAKFSHLELKRQQLRRNVSICVWSKTLV